MLLSSSSPLHNSCPMRLSKLNAALCPPGYRQTDCVCNPIRALTNPTRGLVHTLQDASNIAEDGRSRIGTRDSSGARTEVHERDIHIDTHNDICG